MPATDDRPDMSATLRERPAPLTDEDRSKLTTDEEQDALISGLRQSIKDSEQDKAALERRVEALEGVLDRHKRIFALATGLDPDLSLDVLEALLNKLNEDSGGKGAPNAGANALTSLLKGKQGGQVTGGLSLAGLAVYIFAKMNGWAP